MMLGSWPSANGSSERAGAKAVSTSASNSPGYPNNITTHGTGEQEVGIQPGSGMEFLPLMLTSVYCAVGLGWAFMRMGYLYVRT
jgi:hypothetical protein